VCSDLEGGFKGVVPDEVIVGAVAASPFAAELARAINSVWAGTMNAMNPSQTLRAKLVALSSSPASPPT
jgi:hypothetical protein